MSGDDSVLRVLCVDDESAPVQRLAVLLELVGYDARVCYDGPSALTAAEEFRPDAAILDLMMPGMDGVELGRLLRATGWGADLPLVAVTSLSGETARRRTAAAGFDLHLTKPVDPDRLATVLADIVILRGEVDRTPPPRPAQASPSLPG